jgi:transcription initiation factor TFIIIB Brf1 subunit/transcription initiation factor TFIIB
MDLVKIEFSQWIESSNKSIAASLMAARLLYLCRINKVPVMLHEVCRDFGIRPKNIMHILSEANYVPPLDISDYIYRISRQLGLPDNIRDHALSLLNEDAIIDNTTPIMRACCVLIEAVKVERFNMPRWKITSALGVTTVGVQMALKRLKLKKDNHSR